MAETGYPMPDKPFKTYKAFLAWDEGYWKNRALRQHDSEFLREKNRITGGKSRISTEEYDKLENFKEKYLPPVYGAVFREILEHFNIDPKNYGYRDFLLFNFFLGKKEYSKPTVSINFIRNKKTDETEMFVRIYGHTKKEDITRNWSWIASHQMYLKDFMGKSKRSEKFNRDLEIYLLYKKMREDGKKRHFTYQGYSGLVSNDEKIYADLHKKYPEITLTHIRKIITTTAKRVGDI